VGDFNGDSDPDLATVGLGAGYADVSVWLGGTGGSFGAPTEVAAGSDFGGVEQFRSVAVGDFNGDSDPDLAVANFDDDTVMVLLGGPDGSFAAPTNLPTFGDGPSSVAVGDFNGDSDPDLAVANRCSDNVSVLRGEPGGDFAEPITFAAGDEPISVAVGALDDDPDPDLAVANLLSDNISVLLGGAGADFAEAKTSPPATDPPRSRWATSTSTPAPTWRSPTPAPTTSLCCSTPATFARPRPTTRMR
jgi:large repetitive protein